LDEAVPSRTEKIGALSGDTIPERKKVSVLKMAQSTAGRVPIPLKHLNDDILRARRSPTKRMTSMKGEGRLGSQKQSSDRPQHKTVHLEIEEEWTDKR
jgi:hypothetical protein